MCEHSKKLILWMDGELGADEALVMEKHLQECAECRECLAAYQQASAGFEAYCDAVVNVAEGWSSSGAKAPEQSEQVMSELKLRPPKIRLGREQSHDRHLGDNSSGHGFSRANQSWSEAPAARGEVVASFCTAENRREVPRLAENRSLRDDNVKQKDGGLKPAATKAKRARVAVGIGAMAAAAAIAMVLMQPRHRMAQTPAPIASVGVPAGTASGAGTGAAALAESGGALRAAPHPAERPERGKARSRNSVAERRSASDASHQARNQIPKMEQTESANAVAAEAPIEIAIPTENMFPPGAVPPGIGLTAVVTISADDARQSAGPNSRFTRFPNGGTQP